MSYIINEFGGNYNNRIEATYGCTDTGASV